MQRNVKLIRKYFIMGVWIINFRKNMMITSFLFDITLSGRIIKYQVFTSNLIHSTWDSDKEYQSRNLKGFVCRVQNILSLQC